MKQKNSKNEGFGEKCGVIGIVSSTENAFSKLYLGMHGLQHRGEMGCGMAVSNEEKINYYKDIGLVSDVFQPKTLNNLKGLSGIGHTRYATTPANDFETEEKARKDLHPMIGSLYGGKSFAVAFNGNLTNCNQLKNNLKGFEFETSTDTEIIKNLIIKGYEDKGSLESALKESYDLMQGAYNIIMLDNSGSIYFLKDGHGFKPASIAKLPNDSGYAIASETRAFDFINASFERDINAGELLKIGKDLQIASSQLLPKKKIIMRF